MRTMRRCVAALAAAALSCLAAAAHASPDDAAFARKAAAAGMDEIAGGRLASQRAQDAAVKRFAERMVSDHTKAGAQLGRIAADEGLSLPDKLDQHAEKDLDKLTKLHGHDFDVAYMKGNVAAHEKAVKDFRKEAKTGGDERLRRFAGDTVPVLEEHLRLARAAAKAVGASKPDR